MDGRVAAFGGTGNWFFNGNWFSVNGQVAG